MRFLWALSALAFSAEATKTTGCPLLGPAFPAPTALSKDPTFLRKAGELTSKLNQAIHNGSLPSISFAAQVFSSEEEDTAFGFYHTDPPVRVGSVGVKEVDENSMFRIGSISKLWTMFLFMTFEGTRYFHEPVSKYVPELRTNYTARQAKDSINYLKWSDVTIGELASHQAGLARDYAFGDLSFQPKLMQTMGFPSLPQKEKMTCGNQHQCNRKDFFHGILRSSPLASTSHTPIYSNAGYQILGYALESIAKADYKDILMDRLIKPLNLTRSCLQARDPSLAVIPYNETASWFGYDIGEEAPAGGIFSSAKDMATFGRAVLSSSLVDPAVTRRWMKPLTHTSSLQHSVGAPWEIYTFLTPRRVDLYTKAGDIGMYSSMMGLSPDHNTGITVLVAGSDSHKMTATISEMVSDIMLPALDEVAKKQALKRFGGTYALNRGSSHSSITITADDGAGLVVSEWISNSVDMIETLMSLQKVTDRSKISIRLQPSGLETPGKISFLAVIYSLPVSQDAGPIAGSCFSWILLESMVYGNVGVPEFDFTLNHDGNATSLSPRALRVTLPRV
ncbi:Beta-lactamase-related protein [Penicillium griseofulvum]|uniref:Beta-lactamase-related protein n=1 Tax=Penicillium patulum TaxID=5078 RepID=A0A135LPS0_PENPA|nr:Beta-lactamase-related protein [Penicillium griseofulvum]KXG50964.1 Beta-lactamase-related protein [Penicillium griseofulvum]